MMLPNQVNKLGNRLRNRCRLEILSATFSYLVYMFISNSKAATEEIHVLFLVKK